MSGSNIVQCVCDKFVNASGDGCTDACGEKEKESKIPDNPSQKQCVCKDDYVLVDKKCICLLDLNGKECVQKCGLYQFIQDGRCTCKNGLEPKGEIWGLKEGVTWR